jgi:hypothetical protein
VKGIATPEATLRSTDSPDPSSLSWYTTPEGSHRRAGHPGRPEPRRDHRLDHHRRRRRFRGQPGAVLLQRRVVHRPWRRPAAQPRLSPGRDRPGVPVPDRLHAPVRRPRRQPGRGLCLRARHPGRHLAVAPARARRCGEGGPMDAVLTMSASVVSQENGHSG